MIPLETMRAIKLFEANSKPESKIYQQGLQSDGFMSNFCSQSISDQLHTLSGITAA